MGRQTQTASKPLLPVNNICVMFLQPVLLVLLLSFPLLFPRSHVVKAAESLSPGQSLSGNQTLVSSGGKFELGFFSPGNSGNYYIGIWFSIPTENVVWVANREAPVSNPSTSELRISENGTLVLLNHAKVPVWSSHISSTSTASSAMDSVVATLLDSGNLILAQQSNSSAITWQSFDHLTDTLLPGAWVGLNKVTGEYRYLRSWRNEEDPSPGQYSYHMDEGGSSEFFLRWNGSVTYWETGIWTGRQFINVPEMKSSLHFNFSYVDDGQRRGFTYSVYSDTISARAKVDSSGRIKLTVWLQHAHNWQQVWEHPIFRCDVYSVCGAFGVCNERRWPICKCLLGFEPTNVKEWELGGYWSGGCVRSTRSHYSGCSRSGGAKDGFLAVSGLRLPSNSQELAVNSRERCELACLEDCNCSAYAYGSGCAVWNGELRNVKKLDNGDNNARVLYVRLPSSELPASTTEHTRSYGVIIGVLLGVAALMFALLGLICRFRRRSCDVPKLAEAPLTAFTYANLRHITNNFSEKLGEGGFGFVFKGTLLDSTAVAVKKLEGSSQGEKQFRAEVSTLGNIHHVNLVRLLGFCAEDTKKLLVYGHMPNGSLDAHIFGSNSSSNTLDWNFRYQIILGVARGLAYLHEQCRECIIHCDIKPENILLDAKFQPKVADFGLAKLLDRDFSRVLTTMRGTIGYLAPEWLSGLPITTKADVYSFGMLVLEIISGKRNSQRYESGSIYYFPLLAAMKVIEGEVLGLLDEKLGCTVDVEQLTRACKAACWCIQEGEDHRPSMMQVVQMLEGALKVSAPPVPTSLQHLIEDGTSTTFSLSLLPQNSSTMSL